MANNISQTAGPDQNSGALPGRRQHAPGAGRADGSTGRHASSGSFTARPNFDVTVSNDGYRWWYIDATSDDGKHGLTLIGFVGSVFSPYYAQARKKGQVAAENHCAINVALYGTPRRWAMTERGAKHVTRTAEQFSVGPSSMRWVDGSLHCEIKERCAPLPFPLRGDVTFTPDAFYNAPVQLDAAGNHHWQAVAPHGRIRVVFENPKLSWSGNAYHDMNWGDEPLENGFKHWTWLRANTARGTEVLYDVTRRDGSRLSFGRVFQNGVAQSRDVPDLKRLQRGVWGMSCDVNSETAPRLIARLEDTPFYTRNHIAMTLDGKLCEAYHESLSLDRFVHPVVQLMLPFRMPRLA